MTNSYLIVDAMFCGRSDDGPGELLVNAVLHREDRTHSCAIGNLDKVKILKSFLCGLLHGKFLTLWSCICNLVNQKKKSWGVHIAAVMNTVNTFKRLQLNRLTYWDLLYEKRYSELKSSLGHLIADGKVGHRLKFIGISVTIEIALHQAFSNFGWPKIPGLSKTPYA